MKELRVKALSDIHFMCLVTVFPPEIWFMQIDSYVPFLYTMRILGLMFQGDYEHHKGIRLHMVSRLLHRALNTQLLVLPCMWLDQMMTSMQLRSWLWKIWSQCLAGLTKVVKEFYVQASTLGSLEALLEYLKSPDLKIPVNGIGIGPVHKKDIMKAGVMLERKKEYATILAFDVKVTKEAHELADEMGVKIFCANTIYRFSNQFKAYIEKIKEEKKKESADEAVFPCKLRILHEINKKDPIMLGVKVLDGILKIGTPICVPHRILYVVRIASIENNRTPVDYAKKCNEVSIKNVTSNREEQKKTFGRHFDEEDELVSHISRRSIDILKTSYRDELSIEEWVLVAKLKKILKIQ